MKQFLDPDEPLSLKMSSKQRDSAFRTAAALLSIQPTHQAKEELSAILERHALSAMGMFKDRLSTEWQDANGVIDAIRQYRLKERISSHL